jgi:hypothetical protein
LAETDGLTFEDGASDGDSTLSFTGTVSDLNTALDGLTYTPNDGFNGEDKLSVSASDPGLPSGHNTASASVAITVSSPLTIDVPDAQCTEADTDLTFSADDDNGITIEDSESNDDEITVSLSVDDGILTLAQTDGLTFETGGANGTGALIFTGVLSDINDALDGLTYTPGPGFNGDDLLSISASTEGAGDGDNANIATASVAITVVSPLSINAPDAESTNTGVAVTFSTANSNAITISDSESSADPLTVSLTAEDGTLELATTDGLTIVAGDDSTDAMTFTGTLGDVNTALDVLIYTPESGFEGDDTLTISASRQGSGYSSSPNVATASVDISVGDAGEMVVDDTEDWTVDVNGVPSTDSAQFQVSFTTPDSPANVRVFYSQATRQELFTYINQAMTGLSWAMQQQGVSDSTRQALEQNFYRLSDMLDTVQASSTAYVSQNDINFLAKMQ